MGNLPVYTDVRNSTRKVTIIRKYAGDAEALAREAQRVCDQPVLMYHGRIEVKGHHRKTLTDWLLSLGF